MTTPFLPKSILFSAFKPLCGIECCPLHIAQKFKMGAQRLTLANAGLAPSHQLNTHPISLNNQYSVNNNNVFSNGHLQFRSFKIIPEKTSLAPISSQNMNMHQNMKQLHPSFIHQQQQYTPPYMQQPQLQHQQLYQANHPLPLPQQTKQHQSDLQQQQLGLYLQGNNKSTKFSLIFFVQVRSTMTDSRRHP